MLTSAGTMIAEIGKLGPDRCGHVVSEGMNAGFAFFAAAALLPRASVLAMQKEQGAENENGARYKAATSMTRD
jgi:hypothetical protein